MRCPFRQARPNSGSRRRPSRPVPQRPFRPRAEVLEDRTLPVASHVFAQLEGVVPVAGTKQLDIALTAADFTLKQDQTILGFQVQTAQGSALDPAAVEIHTAAGQVVRADFTNADLAGRTQSLVLAELGLGSYRVNVRGERGTGGAFRLDVFLAADANGDRKVDPATVKGGDGDLIRDLLGSTAGDGRYRVEADANLDGRINGQDNSYWARNQDDRTRVHPLALSIALAPSPVVLANGQLGTNHPQITVQGTTNPDALVKLWQATAVAAASGAFSFIVSLNEGPNRLEVRASDRFGQTRTAVTEITLDTAAPTGLVSDPVPGLVTNHNVTVAGQATDGLSGVAGVQAQVDGGPFFDVPFDAAASTFQFDTALPLDGSADGGHTVTLRATDRVGNVSLPFGVSFTLDTTLPAVPVFDLSVASDSGALGDHQTSAGRVTFVGRTDPDTLVTLLQTGATATSNHTGMFQFPGVDLVPGNNVFTARVADALGNASTFTLTVVRVDAGAAGDVVLDWNRTLLEAVRLDASAPPLASRNMAMVHAAIYDAVSAVDGTPGYYVRRTAPAGTSPVAAVAAAAHRVLSYLYPAQAAAFDLALAASLAQVPAGPGKADGVALGVSMADAIVALRVHDGWDDFVDYGAGSAPGAWQPTPPMYAVALLPQWADLEPFAMTGPAQFHPSGPPALTSSAWASAFNEVKDLGRANSTLRTADQAQIARFWADGSGTYTPPGHWNQIAAQVAQDRHNSLAENARLFAELNIALADAAIVAWEVKYADGFWRPVTAIRAADTDGNAATTLDAAWTPLLVTPPFPEYVSGHSTFSGAAEAILTAAFGDNAGFTIGSSSLPGVQRSFASFHAAAEEACQSRIYGGIHYQFSNQDGLVAGRSLGDYVLDTFTVATDTRAPRITFTGSQPGLTTSQNVSLAGRVTDNLSGVQMLEVQLDAGSFLNVPLDADGNFALPTAFALDHSADGSHVYRFQATDYAGNTSALLEFEITVDTTAPDLSLIDPAANTLLLAGSSLTGTVSDTSSPVTSLSYAFDGGQPIPVGFDPAHHGEFDQPLDLSRLTPGGHTLTVTASDAAGNTAATTLSVTLAAPIPLSVTAFAPVAGADDVGSTFRPKVTFSRPIDPTTLTAANFYATGPSGTALPARIVVANDATFAWLFFVNPMPGASVITAIVDGATIRAADGSLLDAAGTGSPGSKFITRFTTVSLTNLPGTSLSGIVADPGPDLKPGTFDDVRVGPDGVLMTSDDLYLRPLAGVKVYLLGQESQFVLTGPDGRFSLASVPSGNVKLALDGNTVTNAPASVYFPEMVMDLTVEPLLANTVMGTMGTREQAAAMANLPGVYLPRLQTSLLHDVSNSIPTTIGVDATAAPNLTPEQRALLSIEVQPGSLIGPDGQPLAGGQVGISTVPPELVRDMLPPGVLQHTFDITVQAPGIAMFATPAPMTFPNVFNAAPGSQVNFLSFDHTTGRLVIEGTATVSADGKSVRTDPGSGITHPGWHAATPPGTPTGSCSDPPIPRTVDVNPGPRTSGLQDYFFKDDEGSFTLAFRNDANPIDPSKAPCDPVNAVAKAMIVEITVDGPGDKFLEGFHSQSFALLPTQEKQVSVQLTDLIPRLKVIGKDRFYGVTVDIKVYKEGTPETNLLDPDQQQIYVYRYLDAADSDHDDGIVEMIDALNDGPLAVRRLRELEYLGSQPRLEITDTKHFPDEGFPFPTHFTFDPQATGEDLTTTVNVVSPSHHMVGTLTLKGEGSPKIRVDIHKGGPKGLTALLTTLANGAAPAGDVDNILLTATERGLISGHESTIADQVIAQVSTLLTDLAPGIIVEDGAIGTDVIRVDWKTNPATGEFGTSTPGGGVDDVIQLLLLYGSRDLYSEVERTFRLAEALNTTDASNVEMYPDNHWEWPTHGDPDAPNHPLNLTVAQFVNALAFNVAHEVAHTLGALHSAQVAAYPPTITANEHQTIDLSGGTAASTFTLTFEGQTTTPLARNATGPQVQAELEKLSSLGTNIFVTGPAGGPYLVIFTTLLTGVDVPLLTGVGTDSLNLLIAQTTPSASATKFDHEVKIGSLLGRTDILFGGILDLDGSSRFQSGLTLELLKMGLKIGFTPAEAKQAFDYVVEHFAEGGGLPWSSAQDDGGVVELPAGPRLALLSAEDSVLFDSIDFAEVGVDGMGGLSRTKLITLVNFGSEDLILQSVQVADASGQFTASAIPPGTILPPGARMTLNLTFDPTLSGDATGLLTLATNDPTAQTEIQLTGFGRSPVGDIRVEVPNNNAGGAKLGDIPRTVHGFATVRNIGSRSLTVTDVVPDAGSIGQFTVSGLPAGFGPAHPLVLAPGESFALDLVFDAKVLGLQRGRLHVFSDDPDTSVFILTVVGTGLADAGSALEYGNDFVAVETPFLSNSPVLHQKSDQNGHWEFFLPQQTALHTAIFDPLSGLLAESWDTTQLSGRRTTMTPPLFQASTAPDTDGDGLPDDIEFAVGTSSAMADTDRDGLDDFVELQQGLDPLGGRAFPTGIVASLALDGNALDVVAEDDIAYVVTTQGLAVVDVSQFTRPRLLGQLPLPLPSSAQNNIAVDPQLGIAALGSGQTLYLVDVSDPTHPRLRQTLLNLLMGTPNPVAIAEGVAYVPEGGGVGAIDLLTGQKLGEVPLGTVLVNVLAREGTKLYAMAGETFYVIDVSEAGLPRRMGQVPVPFGANTIQVGNGVAYLAQGFRARGVVTGLVTVDVSDPNSPTIISGPDTFYDAPEVAVNGSGLALLTIKSFITTNSTLVEVHSLGVFDVTDPTITDAFRFRIDTPGTFPLDTPGAPGLALASGLALVADGPNGLQVINYLPFDIQGQAPTVSIMVSLADLDSATGGFQVLAGSTVPVRVQVFDDVQVQRVELLVNGQVVQTDVSFPWDFYAVALGDSLQPRTVTIQVRATDTGGNVGLSNLLVLDVVPESVPPTIVSIAPADGSTASPGLQTVRLRFSEPMAAATLTTQTLQLRQSDGTVLVPLNLQTRVDDRLVQLTFSPLSAGTFELVIDAAAITDRAGNPLGTAAVVSRFTVLAQSVVTDLFPDRVYLTPDQPLDLASADLNGDGKVDLITLTPDVLGATGNSTFSVFLGHGDGTFAPRSDFAVNGNVTAFELGDVNGDGRVDLVAANTTIPGSVLVLLGAGDGTFGPATSFPTADSPLALALGDVDGDGDLDVVTAGGRISVLFGAGDGTFGPRTDYSLLGFDVLLRDLEGDGDLDLLVGHTGAFSVMLGRGDGTFASNVTYASGPPGLGNTYLAADDLDGDGDLEVVALGDTIATVWLGRPDGTLANRVDYAVNNGSALGASLALADLTGDGQLDLVVGNYNIDPFARHNVAVLSGRGDGSFGTFLSYTARTAPVMMAVADWDTDGDLDLALSGSAGYVALMVGTGTGSFPVEPDLDNHGLFAQGTVTLADLDGDGVLDIVTAGAGSGVPFIGPAVSVLRGTGGATYAPAVYFPVAPSLSPFASAVTSMALGDLNRDGAVDLVAAYEGSSSGISPLNTSVLFGRGDGTFGSPTALGFAAQSVALGDLDGDGFLDLVTATAVYPGNGDGTFAAPIPLPFAPFALPGGINRQVALGDLDNDGDLDVVTLDEQFHDFAPATFRLSVYVTTVLASSLTFVRTDYPVNDSTRSLTLGDVDGDGVLDLVTGGFVFLGTGTGAFSPGLAHDEIVSPVLGDVDADGNLDLVGIGYPLFGSYPLTNNGFVTWLPGQGDGTFAARRDYAVDVEPTAVALGDLDNDGDLDFVTVNTAVSFAGTTVSPRLNRLAQAAAGLMSLSFTRSTMAVGADANDPAAPVGTVGGKPLLAELAPRQQQISGDPPGLFSLTTTIVINPDQAGLPVGSDILLGGFTSYDLNYEALCAVATEWTRSDVNHSTRADHLLDAAALADVLTRSTEADWFCLKQDDDDAQDEATGLSILEGWFAPDLDFLEGPSRNGA